MPLVPVQVKLSIYVLKNVCSVEALDLTFNEIATVLHCFRVALPKALSPFVFSLAFEALKFLTLVVTGKRISLKIEVLA